MKRVSVIINTCNRAEFIKDTLEALKYQTYQNFEVIVVNGPSTDNTEEVVRQYRIRYYTAPYNISISRNIGIKNASGDILAFIDDDAIPEPEWLDQLVQAYGEGKKIGAVGGRVYNDTGNDFQYSYGAIDKWGYVLQRHDSPYDFNKPDGFYYNINIGTNASFLRKALVEIGGFDEEIEYYHDESDVCVRLIRAGYKVIQLDNAFVHHKYARSSRRRGDKVVTDWDAIVKNTIYFGIKNTKGNSFILKRLIKPFWAEKIKYRDLGRLRKSKVYTFKEYVYKNYSLTRTMIRGYKRGFFEARKLLNDYTYQSKEFKKYNEDSRMIPMRIVLVTQGYPPKNTDGISRYSHTIAKELARRGHHVYVVTRSHSDTTSIEYIENVWVYKHIPGHFYTKALDYENINNLLANSKSAYDTVKKIHQKSKLDIIVAPLWDVEALALEHKKIAPVILTLMTPLKKVVETQWGWAYHESMEITYDLERDCIECADAIMSISGAIKDTIGEQYGVDWTLLEEKKPVVVLPLGVDKELISSKAIIRRSRDKTVNVLFVGRLEKRKGIDVLMKAIPNILEKHKNVKFQIVGNDAILHENKINFKEEFIRRSKKESWFKNVEFFGYVTDKELNEMYEQCDIFVAPSRYESFGIIFIEAMAKGKPVIGTNVGGIPEIVSDGENGFLFENENAIDLQNKLLSLIEDERLRRRMGEMSLRILKERFSAKTMVDNLEDLINKTLALAGQEAS